MLRLTYKIYYEEHMEYQGIIIFLIKNIYFLK